MNPQPPDLESGALAVRATGPCHGHELSDSELGRLFPDGARSRELSCFAVNRMLSTKATILLALQSIGGGALVLQSGVITLSTAAACQRDDFPHGELSVFADVPREDT